MEDITGGGNEDLILMSTLEDGGVQIELLTVDRDGMFQQVAVMGLSADKFSGCAAVAAGLGADGKRYLVLDGVQDPGNVGTIWRTADALGADGLILVNGCADPWNPKTVRATMGACFRLPVYERNADGLAQWLGKQGIPLYATALREDTVDLRKAELSRCAVVIGSEGRGVSEGLLSQSAKTLKIPMRARCESLNAAAAATVVLWEMGR